MITPVSIVKSKSPGIWNIHTSRMCVDVCMHACECVVLGRQQQHHWNLLEVKCSGPPRPVLNQTWDNDGAHDLFAKKPFGVLGDLEVLI